MPVLSLNAAKKNYLPIAHVRVLSLSNKHESSQQLFSKN